jgi:hypothetical protein
MIVEARALASGVEASGGISSSGSAPRTDGPNAVHDNAMRTERVVASRLPESFFISSDLILRELMTYCDASPRSMIDVDQTANLFSVLSRIYAAIDADVT